MIPLRMKTQFNVQSFIDLWDLQSFHWLVTLNYYDIGWLLKLQHVQSETSPGKTQFLLLTSTESTLFGLLTSDFAKVCLLILLREPLYSVPACGPYCLFGRQACSLEPIFVVLLPSDYRSHDTPLQLTTDYVNFVWQNFHLQELFAIFDSCAMLGTHTIYEVMAL